MKHIEVLNGFKVKEPIPVKIEHDEHGVIGTVEELGLSVLCYKEKEVITKLKEEIITLYEKFLQFPQSKLGKEAQIHKKYLLEHIEKSNV